MRIKADGFDFNFKNALDVFVFDEQDETKPTYHGLPMKAVDLVAEFPNAYVYVEMKNFDDSDMYDPKLATDDKEIRKRRDHFKWLKNYLKYKYRDSYLFRHAEDTVNKPIHYVCLLTFDNALNITMQKALRKELPVGLASTRWKREIVKSCHVVNVAKWNATFPKWPVQQLSDGDTP